MRVRVLSDFEVSEEVILMAMDYLKKKQSDITLDDVTSITAEVLSNRVRDALNDQFSEDNLTKLISAKPGNITGQADNEEDRNYTRGWFIDDMMC